MEARDIIEKKFNKGLNGYKMEEVDDFLQEVSAEVANLKKQNEELEKKMEVLADKIREYRNDEDAIKEALLDAQKQSKTVQASAKEKSDKMVSDAKEKSEKMIKDAEEKVKEKDAYAKKLVDDANAEKTKIIAECERKSAEIKANMDAETKKQESIIAKTREESNAYVAKLLKAYEEHIALIKAIPGKCQNQFVLNMKDTLKLEEKKEEPASAPAAASVSAKPDEKKDAPAPEKKLEPITFEKTSEIASKHVFEEESVTEEVEEFDENNPLFDKSKHKSKFEKLQFGSNSNKAKE